MIASPYKTLREILGQEEGWQPEWAERLEVRRMDDRTVYIAQPERITPGALTDLQRLTRAGWEVIIDGPRLGRIRISMTETIRYE